MIRVLGCGNLLAYDEGLGIHAARELKKCRLPAGVSVMELRRPGLLLHELICGPRKLIIIDAMASGRKAGYFERFALTDENEARKVLARAIHGFNLLPVFERGGRICGDRLPAEIVLYAMEVTERSTFCVGLSAPVREALPSLVKAVLAEMGISS
jgi:hydrogenase maturation protease